MITKLLFTATSQNGLVQKHETWYNMGYDLFQFIWKRPQLRYFKWNTVRILRRGQVVSLSLGISKFLLKEICSYFLSKEKRNDIIAKSYFGYH